MDRFYTDLDALIKSKAKDIYLDVCKEIIEQNGLKDHAIKLSLKICDFHLENEKGKDPLTSHYSTFKLVKNEVAKQ